MSRRAVATWTLLALGTATAGLFAARLCLGRAAGWPNDPAILNLRLISACAAAVVGVCLATSGVYLQTLLRNPLAEPYILGLAAGAGLGVSTAALAWRTIHDSSRIVEVSAPVVVGTGEPHAASVAPWWLDNAAGLAGALIVLAVVYALGQRRGIVEPLTLLLAGVIVSAICGALIVFVQYLSPGRDADMLLRWMMGRLSPATPESALVAGGVVAAGGLGVGLWLAPALDAAAMSDEEALTVGVPLHRIRLALLGLSGLMTAVAVSMSGPIGFVGLIAPHIARRLLGHRHTLLMPGAACVGAGLLLLADSAVQVLPQPRGLLPVGILTSAIGGPLFIALLHRERVGGAW